MGIMMLRLMHLRLAVAAGILSLTVASAWAFSQQIVSPGSDGNYNFGDPDKHLADPDNSSSGQGVRPFGSNGPAVQFGVQQNSSTIFGRSNGYNTTPDPYFRPLNGN
jgi:hypothetical protein